MTVLLLNETMLNFYKPLRRSFGKTLTVLHVAVCSTVDPYFIITFGQNAIGLAVIVVESLLYQII